MNLEIWRYNSGERETLGFLMQRVGGTWHQVCFTLEQRGQHRVSAGSYAVRRDGNPGPTRERYRTRKWPLHEDMLKLWGVYKVCHFLEGQEEDQADGIILGDSKSEYTPSIAQCTPAYDRVYREISKALKAGESVRLNIRDMDRL